MVIVGCVWDAVKMMNSWTPTATQFSKEGFFLGVKPAAAPWR